MHSSNMCKNDLLKKRFPTWKLKLGVVGTKEVQHLVQQLIIFFINNQNLISKKYAYLLYVNQVQMIYKKKAFITRKKCRRSYPALPTYHFQHFNNQLLVIFPTLQKTWLKRERISNLCFASLLLIIYIMGLLDDNPCTTSYGEKRKIPDYTNNLFKLPKLLNLAQKGWTLPSTSQSYSIAHAF